VPLRTIDQCGDPAGINFPQLLGGRYFRRRDILRASILCHPRIIYDLGEARNTGTVGEARLRRPVPGALTRFDP